MNIVSPPPRIKTAPFQWDDAFLLDEQLTEDERMIRDAARAFCQDRLMPGVLMANRHETFDRSIMNAFGEQGFLGATLEGYGGMLEQLVRGKLISASSLERLFGYMKFGKRGDYRLEGGIPKSEMIIHKTGTQYRRACHMAVINPQQGGVKGIVVTTCASDMDDEKEAGGIFKRVGEAVSKTALVAMTR